MLSDAGGALARRRRDIFSFSRLRYNFQRTFLLLVILLPWNSSFPIHVSHKAPLHDETIKSLSVNLLYLVWNFFWPAVSMKEDCLLSTRSLTAISENCLSKIYRSKDLKIFAVLVASYPYWIPLKSNISSPSDWSSILTPEPVMIFTAEGLSLTLPSSYPTAPWPYSRSGTRTSLIEATLGFHLLDFSSCCGPLALSQSIAKNPSPPTIHYRARFNYFISSPSPFISLLCFHDLINRRSCLYPEATNNKRCCEHSFQNLLLNCPLIKVYETLSRETIDEHSFLKALSLAHLFPLSEIQRSDIVTSNSTSLVPIISAWSSRGFLGSSILGSSEWSKIYPCQLQPISSVWVPLLLNSNLKLDPTSCVNLKLTTMVPNCHISPKERKLGSATINQGQTGCKLCVKLLNLHGHEIHVREDSPALLQFVTQLFRYPVEAPRDICFNLKMLNDVGPTTLPLMLVIHPSSDTTEKLSFQSSISLAATATYDHLVVKDFAKLVFMVESTLVPTDSHEELMEPLSLLSFDYLVILLYVCKNSPLYEDLI